MIGDGFAERSCCRRRAWGVELAKLGAAAAEEDSEPFTERKARRVDELRAQQKEAARRDAAIAANLKELGYDG